MSTNKPNEEKETIVCMCVCIKGDRKEDIILLCWTTHINSLMLWLSESWMILISTSYNGASADVWVFTSVMDVHAAWII